MKINSGERFASWAIRCCFGDTLFKFLSTRRSSQHRLCDVTLRFPPPGPRGVRVPRPHRYYQNAPTPCCLSRLASVHVARQYLMSLWFVSYLPSSPQQNDEPRVGRPVSQPDSSQGNNRASQVSGEPQYPSAHGLRPRSDNRPLTRSRLLHGSR